MLGYLSGGDGFHGHGLVQLRVAIGDDEKLLVLPPRVDEFSEDVDGAVAGNS